MAKAKIKTYRVQKRFEVWVEVEITAASFDQAVAEGKDLKLADFMTTVGELNDSTELQGFGVQEQW